MKVVRRVNLGLPYFLLPLDGSHFTVCVANLCSGNLNIVQMHSSAKYNGYM